MRGNVDQEVTEVSESCRRPLRKHVMNDRVKVQITRRKLTSTAGLPSYLQRHISPDQLSDTVATIN